MFLCPSHAWFLSRDFGFLTKVQRQADSERAVVHQPAMLVHHRLTDNHTHSSVVVCQPVMDKQPDHMCALFSPATNTDR